MNITGKGFGYPETLLWENEDWAILFRAAQVTLGSLVIVSKCEARSMSELSGSAYCSLKATINQAESVLLDLFAPDRFNYLVLMMIDPHVHCHLIPRYEKSRSVFGQKFLDRDWPYPPDLSRRLEDNSDTNNHVFDLIKNAMSQD